MDRRKFLLGASLMSAALTSGIASRGAFEKPAPARRVGRDGELTLGNDALAWQFVWLEGRLTSSRFENKLSGHRFPLSEAQEMTLTFSASKHRVEIPWWNFVFGPAVGQVGSKIEVLHRGAATLTLPK